MILSYLQGFVVFGLLMRVRDEVQTENSAHTLSLSFVARLMPLCTVNDSFEAMATVEGKSAMGDVSEQQPTIAPERWLTRSDPTLTNQQIRMLRVMRLAPPISATAIPPVVELPRRLRRRVPAPTYAAQRALPLVVAPQPTLRGNHWFSRLKNIFA